MSSLAWPPSKEDLERLYLAEKLSAAKIAKTYGLKYKNDKVAESVVLYQLKKLGIKRRDRTEHIRKVTEEMVDEWVRRYQGGESLKQIAGDQVDPVTVWNHLRARGCVLRDKVQAQILAVTKYQKNPFHGDNLEKAYLSGLRYGDFNAVIHGRSIRIRVSTTHQAMAILFESLFSPYGHVHWYPREAQFSGYEWTLECDLDSSFEFLLTKVTLEELEGLTRGEFLSFLAGLIDAEGSIYLHRKRYGSGFEITISNTDRPLLERLVYRLSGLGYHPRLETKNQNDFRLGYFKSGKISVIRLERQFEVCELLKMLGLRHGEKDAKSTFVSSRICDAIFGAKKDEEDDWRELTNGIKRDRDAFVRTARMALERGADRRRMGR